MLMKEIANNARRAYNSAVAADDYCKSVPRATKAAVDAEICSDWAQWLLTLANRIETDRQKRKDLKVKTLVAIADVIEQCAIQARECERSAQRVYKAEVRKAGGRP